MWNEWKPAAGVIPWPATHASKNASEHAAPCAIRLLRCKGVEDKESSRKLFSCGGGGRGWPAAGTMVLGSASTSSLQGARGRDLHARPYVKAGRKRWPPVHESSQREDSKSGCHDSLAATRDEHAVLSDALQLQIRRKCAWPSAQSVWAGPHIGWYKGGRRYRGVVWDDTVFEEGCHATLYSGDEANPYLAQVLYLWENAATAEPMITCRWFYRQQDVPVALLDSLSKSCPGNHPNGGTSNGSRRALRPNEIFCSNVTDDNPVASLAGLCKVEWVMQPGATASRGPPATGGHPCHGKETAAAHFARPDGNDRAHAVKHVCKRSYSPAEGVFRVLSPQEGRAGIASNAATSRSLACTEAFRKWRHEPGSGQIIQAGSEWYEGGERAQDTLAEESVYRAGCSKAKTPKAPPQDCHSKRKSSKQAAEDPAQQLQLSTSCSQNECTVLNQDAPSAKRRRAVRGQRGEGDMDAGVILNGQDCDHTIGFPRSEECCVLSDSGELRDMDSPCVEGDQGGFEWVGAVLKAAQGRRYYSCMRTPAGEHVPLGATVSVWAPKGRPQFLAKVVAMWENDEGGHKMYECRWFFRPSQALPAAALQEARQLVHPREVFWSDEFDVNHVNTIAARTIVAPRDILPADFDLDSLRLGGHFFYSRKYERAARRLLRLDPGPASARNSKAGAGGSRECGAAAEEMPALSEDVLVLLRNADRKQAASSVPAGGSP